MEFPANRADREQGAQLVLGQSHFIKTVGISTRRSPAVAAPSVRPAFCVVGRVSSCVGNTTGWDLAVRNALAIGAGHSFIVFLRDGFPVNVLNAIKAVPEVCRVFCASANPVDVVVAVTPEGRGILGVIDGGSPLGVETEEDVAERRALLRRIGYKC
jgi:adenosine/AMP kinase